MHVSPYGTTTIYTTIVNCNRITLSSSLFSPTTYFLSERHLILHKDTADGHYKEVVTYRKCRALPQCQMDNE